MRVLQVTPAFPPSAHGGISTHVGLLSKGLVALGHDVRVVTTNRYDFRRVMPFSGLRTVEGVRTYYARAYPPGRYFFAPSVVKVIRDWARDADIVHVHDTRTFVGLSASFAARTHSIPYVVTCHGSLSTSIGSSSLKGIHDHLIGKGLVRRASRIVALNDQELSDIVDFGIPREKVVIVPNAIPVADSIDGGLFLEKGKDVRAAKTILFLGRIHPIKGIDRLIEAFSLVDKTNNDCRLLIVGQDYGAQRSLSKLVKRKGLDEKVDFPGPIYGKEKDELLEASDVLVLPSYRETFPLVILEAFAAGLPVVTTAGCGIAGELRSHQAALVVSSTAEMASAIEQCLHDSHLAGQLRRNAISLLKTTYSWDSVLKQISMIYGEVAG